MSLITAIAYPRSYLSNITRCLSNSPIAKTGFAAFCIASGTYGSTYVRTLPAIMACATVALAGIILLYKMMTESRMRLYHELGLGGLHLLTYYKPSWLHWWDSITPQITLGALPLNNSHRIAILERSHAVLSMVQGFELEGIGFFPNPVTRQDWADSTVSHRVIEVEDDSAPTLEQIEEGVRFVHEQTLVNRNVHVHCKAGKGRSALIVICYLAKYKKMTFEDAYELVRIRRSIVRLNEAQIKAAREYINCETL